MFLCIYSAIQVPSSSTSSPNVIASFGGGARYSNAVTLLHVTRSKSEENSEVFRTVLSTPQTFIQDNESDIPAARTSAVAVRVGRYMIVQGGWSMATRELGDIWVRCHIVYKFCVD